MDLLKKTTLSYEGYADDVWVCVKSETVLRPEIGDLSAFARGAAIPMSGELGGVTYGAFIVPGLIMLTVIKQSVSNASFAIHFP